MLFAAIPQEWRVAVVEQGFAFEWDGQQIRHAVFGLEWAWKSKLAGSEVCLEGGRR